MLKNRNYKLRWIAISIVVMALMALFVVSVNSNNELTTPPEEPNTPLPAIMVDDILYYLTGELISVEISKSDYYGQIVYVESHKGLPTKNGQANFPLEGAPYAKYQDGIVVLMNDGWELFEIREDILFLEDTKPLTYQEAKRLMGDIRENKIMLKSKQNISAVEKIILETLISYGIYKDNEVRITLLDDSDEMIGLFKKHLLVGVEHSDAVIFEKGVPEEAAEIKDSGELVEVEILELKSVYKLVKALNKAEIDINGNVIPSGEIRYRFNEFGKQYRIRYMPNVENYVFEYQGAAIWYMFFIWDMGDGPYQGKISSEVIELSLQELFSFGTESFPELEHRDYRKYVRLRNGFYSRWPEGAGDYATVYRPVEIQFDQSEEGYLLKASIEEFSFETDDNYTPNEQDLLLREEAKRLNLSLETTLMYLLEQDQMDIFEPTQQMTLEMFIDSDEIPHILMFNDGKVTPRVD
jgi:hypothetical protein